jgi:predicted phage terminase large subunit-like protein
VRTDLPDPFALARADLGAFAALVVPDFELAPHVELLISALEQVERGEVKRLLVSLPPRHSKSLTCSTLFPAWYLGRRPGSSVIAASHSQELADLFGRRARNLLLEDHFRAAFPDCRLSMDSASASRFDTSVGGSFFGAGRGAALVGRGANLVLLDDVIRGPEEAASPAVRAQLREWFSQIVFTRLQPGAAIVVIGTRWSSDDLIGWLQTEHSDQGWRTINLPAISEENDPLGREPGAALWPERYPLPVLESIRQQLGSAAFTALYQGRPTQREGGIFKRAWFQFYRDRPAKFDEIIQSWDTAFKVGKTNDYSVGITLGVAKNGFYLLHVLRKRLEFPELKAAMIEMADQWKPWRILIEDKASGQSVLQELKLGTRLPILPIKVDADKVTRASAASALVEAGRVFLPEPSVAGWVEDPFLDEILLFPNGAHDDQVDAFVQALNFLRGKAKGPFFFVSAEQMGASPAQLREARWGGGDEEPFMNGPANARWCDERDARRREDPFKGF